MEKHHLIHESYGDYEKREKYTVGIIIVIIGFFIAGGFLLYYIGNPRDLSAWILILIGIAIMFGGWKIMMWSRKRSGRGHRISFG